MTAPTEIIDKAISDLAATIAEETDADMPMCTGWVLVAAWTDVSGQHWASRLWADGMPEWNRDGLLRHATGSWGDRE